MNLQKSILQTIAFFDIFNFPLTAEEIQENLYNYKKPVHIKEIKGTLEEMEGVEKLHDYYILKDRGKLVDIRKSRRFLAEKLWNRTRQYTQYITHIPFVRMIAVCNNLAYDNPSEVSDIDLFIVIEKGRMWTARLITTLILHFYGVRRYGNKIVGRFCLSFFATPEAMNMEKLELKREDPYLAYWTKLLMPIYGKKTYAQFIEMNKKWIDKKYGLKFRDIKERKFSFLGKSWIKKFWEWLLKGKRGDLLEQLIKSILEKRARKKADQLGPEANILISDDMLKFHNQDRRGEYLEKWKELTK